MIEAFSELVKKGNITESEIVELKHLLLDLYKDLKDIELNHKTEAEIRLKFHSGLFTKRFTEMVNGKI